MIVILCYFVCAISRRSWVRHRLWVGAAFGGLMLFSTTATFGLLSVFGMDLNFLCVLVPFLVIGVSVDTGILYVNSLEFLGNDGTLALKKVGPSVLGATLTSVMSFAIGTITDVPGIRVFCICAAVMFVVTFLATIISLPIVLTWDNDRISRQQGCCCTCSKNANGVVVPARFMGPHIDAEATMSTADTEITVVQMAIAEGGNYTLDQLCVVKPDNDQRACVQTCVKLRNMGSKAFKRTSVKICTILMFMGLFGGLLAAMILQTSVGLDYKRLVSDDSYLQDYFDVSTKSFGGDVLYGASVLLDGIENYISQKDEVDVIMAQMTSLDRVVETDASQRWYREFNSWNDKELCHPRESHETCLDRFLIQTPTMARLVSIADGGKVLYPGFKFMPELVLLTNLLRTSFSLIQSESHHAHI
jgi:hypothetical protein